ncbi:MAG: hypothetical protein KDF65_02880 [Anaerolineae bacterium]|nr:hypothetical protein [Anaerolineae bacterium]
MVTKIDTSQRSRPIKIEVQDLTESVPDSNLAAIIYFHPLDRYVEVSKDGTVRLISAAGTVSAQFKEAEKRDLLRQTYLQMLLSNGVRGADLERALTAIERVEQRLKAEGDVQTAEAELELRTKEHLQAWLESKGLAQDALSEDQQAEQIEQGLARVRREKNR